MRRNVRSVPALALLAILAACSAFGDGASRTATGTDGGGLDASASLGDGGDASLGTYDEEVLRDNPRVYWRLADPPGARARDEAPGQVSATYGDSCLHLTQGLLGSTDDPSVQLAGNCAIEARIPFDFDGTRPFTFEAWIRWTGATGTAGGREWILGRGSSSGDDETTVFIEDGQLRFWRRIATDSRLASERVDRNVVYHVVATFDGGALQLFLDGRRRVQIPDDRPQNAMPETNFIIGRSPNAELFTGFIDEVAIYERALPEAAIQRHYAASGGPRP